MKKKIAVALSGGTDSGYAACILKERGWDVYGFTLDLGVEGFIQRINEARDLCRRLSIPHFVIDSRQDFQKKIIDYFTESYLKGLTPNPCVYCNEKIKFGVLFSKIKLFGLKYLATGHYARITRKGKFSLLRCGKDKKKTQEYFLARIPARVLPHLVFPLGDYCKEQVKLRMRRKGLADKGKGESQDICFIKNSKLSSFIAARIDDADKYRGEIRHIKGKVLGKHKGIYNFTYGQRNGLGVSWKEPLYVIDIDSRSKQITIGEKEFTYRDKFNLGELNFFLTPRNLAGIDTLLDDGPKENFRVKFRYNSPFYSCRFHHKGKNLGIRLKEKAKGIAPGQLAVLYYKDYVIGSGIIQKFGNPRPKTGGFLKENEIVCYNKW